MNIRLDRMSSDFNGTLERTHCILWMGSLVSSMGNSLGSVSTCSLFGLHKGTLGKISDALGGVMVCNKRSGVSISIFSCSSGSDSAIFPIFVQN
jgi:hypothetical protein